MCPSLPTGGQMWAERSIPRGNAADDTSSDVDVQEVLRAVLSDIEDAADDGRVAAAAAAAAAVPPWETRAASPRRAAKPLAWATSREILAGLRDDDVSESDVTDAAAAASQAMPAHPPNPPPQKPHRRASFTAGVRKEGRRPHFVPPSSVPDEYDRFAKGKAPVPEPETPGEGAERQHTAAAAAAVVKEARKREAEARQAQRELARAAEQAKRLEVAGAKRERFAETLAEELRILRGRNRELERNAEAAARRERLQLQRDQRSQGEIMMRRQRGREAAEVAGAEVTMRYDVDGTGCLLRVWTWMRTYARHAYARHAPFLRDVRFIEAKFGESIALYFSFHNWMFHMSLLLSVVCFVVFGAVHLSLLLRHGIDVAVAEGNATAAPPADVNSLFPLKWLWFGSYQRSERTMLSLSVISVIIGYAFCFLFKLVAALRHQSFRAFEEEYFDSVRYGKTALCVLNVTARSQREADTVRFAAVASLKMLLDEDNRVRTTHTALRLIMLRVALGVTQGVLLVGSWLVLLIIKLNEKAIQEAFEFGSGVVWETISSFVPSALITFVTATLPPSILLLTTLEKWESPEVTLVLLVLRVYFSQISTLVILIIQGYETLFDVSIFGAIGTSTEVTCPQDELALTLLRLVLVKTAAKIIGGFAYIHAKPLVYVTLLRRSPLSGMCDFDTAREIVDLLYVQALLWLILPFSPFFLVFGAMLVGILLWWDVYLMLYKLKRPAVMWSPKDTTTWFLGLFFITFVLCHGWNYYMFAQLSHFECGAFQGTELSMFDHLWAKVKESRGVENSIRIGTSPVLLFLLTSCVGVLMFRKHYQKEAMREHVGYCKDQIRTDAEMYQKQIAALKAQVQHLSR